MTTLGSMNVSTRIVAAMLPLVLPLAGCATVRQSFPGSTADQVWTVLVTVAERPQYDDWTVPTTSCPGSRWRCCGGRSKGWPGRASRSPNQDRVPGRVRLALEGMRIEAGQPVCGLRHGLLGGPA